MIRKVLFEVDANPVPTTVVLVLFRAVPVFVDNLPRVGRVRCDECVGISVEIRNESYFTGLEKTNCLGIPMKVFVKNIADEEELDLS